MISKTSAEPILDPDLPVIDTHRHLWLQSEAALAAMEAENTLIVRLIGPTYKRHTRYMLDEFLTDGENRHNVTASIYCTSQAMVRTTGPEHMRSVGELEFSYGIADMAASDNFDSVQVRAGIISGLDLRLAEAVEAALEAHIRASGRRCLCRRPQLRIQHYAIALIRFTVRLVDDDSKRRNNLDRQS